MAKRLWCSALVLLVSTSASVAQFINSERVRFHLPGLAIRDICTITIGAGECSFSGPSGEIVKTRLESLGLHGGITDSTGLWYGTDVVPGVCGSGGAQDARIFRVRPDGSAELVLSLLGCPPSYQYPADFNITGLTLDAVNGKLLFSLLGAGLPTLVELSGLPTLLDIIPTFKPASETLSWVTPKYPEALPAADRFSVYAGDMADLRADRDFTRAAPVDCFVPDAGAPQPGDYLTALGV